MTEILNDLTAARDAALTAFGHAHSLEQEARLVADRAYRDGPQQVYVAALDVYQRASERTSRCSAALAALDRACDAERGAFVREGADDAAA